MLRRYYRELCTEAIVAELGAKKLRRTQRLMLKALRLRYGRCEDQDYDEGGEPAS